MYLVRIRKADAGQCFGIQRELADTPELAPWQRDRLQEAIESRLRFIDDRQRLRLAA